MTLTGATWPACTTSCRNPSIHLSPLLDPFRRKLSLLSTVGFGPKPPWTIPNPSHLPSARGLLFKKKSHGSEHTFSNMASDWLGPLLATNRKPTINNIVHVSLSSVEKKSFPSRGYASQTSVFFRIASARTSIFFLILVSVQIAKFSFVYKWTYFWHISW